MNQPNFMQVYNQFMQNPIQALSQRYSIPQDLNNPNDIIQHLINTNQVSQQQVNNLMRLRNNPFFKGRF